MRIKSIPMLTEHSGKRSRALWWVAVFPFIAFCQAPAVGQVTDGWIDARGLWSVPSNWNCSCVPNGTNVSADVFVPGSTAMLDINVSLAGLSVDQGGTVDVQNSHTLTSGLDIIGLNTSGTLNVTSVGVLNDADAIIGDIGSPSFSNGTVNVTGVGAQWKLSDTLVIAQGGTGALSIESGAVVSAATSSIVGYFTGSRGSVTVNGATWNAGTLTVGDFGQGTLTIQGGGTVSSAGGTIAANTGSVGGVLVTGSGSHWNNSGVLGVNANGVLTISNGGVVNNGGGVFDNHTATVTGTGSQWNSGFIEVGSAAPGMLTIETGGAVKSGTGFIGNFGFAGNATVTGSGSTWTTSDIVVGSGGRGTLTIQGGGNVNATGTGFIGSFNATGDATVTDAGSQWNLSALEVGSTTHGTGLLTGFLTIENGGVVNSGGTSIGTFAGSSGTATVTGTGSQWITSSQCVGCGGKGSLTIKGGATGTSTNGLSIGSAAGVSGTMLVTDPGSKWTNTDSFMVGVNGQGSLTLQNGGQVTTSGGSFGGLYLGSLPGSSGNATVSGAGSKITADFVTVGEKGRGSLTIQNGGHVTTNGGLYIGYYKGSSGTVTVTGPGSQLTAYSADVAVGSGGDVTVSNGGVVKIGVGGVRIEGGGSVTVAWNGAFTTAGAFTNNGSLTTTGSGSKFTTGGNFSNTGTLTIGSSSAFTVGGTGMFTQTVGTTTDDGTLTLASPGSLSLQGGSLFGKGAITGAVTSSGTVTPGDSTTATGILKDTGAYTQKAAGTLDISIEGTTAGTQYDQLDPTKASLNGTLNINRPTGFVPSIGSTFKIMSFSSEGGKFTTVNGLAINSSEHFTITYQPTDVLLTVASGPCCGPVPGSGQFNASSALGPTYSAMGLSQPGFALHGRGTLINFPRLGPRVSAMSVSASPRDNEAFFGGQAQFGPSTGTIRSRTLLDFSSSSQFRRGKVAGRPAVPGASGLSLARLTGPEWVQAQGTVRWSDVTRLHRPHTLNIAAAPPSFIRAGASRAISYRGLTASIPAPHSRGSMGRKSLDFNINVLPLLGLSPRHLGETLRQPGSANLGYVTLRGF